jgi:hypothetical protein
MMVHMAVASDALTWTADPQGHYHADVIVAAASQEIGKAWNPTVITVLQITPRAEATTPPHQLAEVQFKVPYRNDGSSRAERWRVVLQDEATRRIGSSEFRVK